MNLLNQFTLTDRPVYCERYGNGHINTTYLVMDASARQYILQKINTAVFKDPEALMRNILYVTDHMRLYSASARNVMTLLQTKDGKSWYKDEDGGYWRVYEFISDSICMDKAATHEDFKESGVAFGGFQKLLEDFNASLLIETIPDFHDTPKRYLALHDAIRADSLGRAKSVASEINFALEREEYAGTLISLQNKGELRLRVTHNDTKLNNVLFDRRTRKALCVIDMDTVMPGLAVNDFGDSIRFGASTGAEDERNLDKINFSLDLYGTYAEGFLSACGDALSEGEIMSLRDGAKMMTLECGVRFLTDYLAGDTYFRVSREGHNLDRCRTQFKLVSDMERQWDKMLLRVQ